MSTLGRGERREGGDQSMFFIPNEPTIIAQVGTAWACDNLFDQLREGKNWLDEFREGRRDSYRQDIPNRC